MLSTLLPPVTSPAPAVEGAAERLPRHARPDASMTIGRDRRSFTPLNKDDIKFPSYDTAGRQEAGMDESIDAKMSFKDAHLV